MTRKTKNREIRPAFFRLSGAIAARMARLLAVGLLFASSAQAQVIEEEGFPAKGGNNYDESFALSCPSRLHALAGESVLLSCAATNVPEEGVRYRWESLSGDGIDFIDALDKLSPLFTAPVSGAGAEYAYRLTTVGATLYETAMVIVTVGGVASGSVRDTDTLPGFQDKCDPLAFFDEPVAGCPLREGDLDPLGFVPEEEFLIPETPDLPDAPDAPPGSVRGGFGSQEPPRLDCPAAIFLEELETGAINCRAWDAAGEEYLAYFWEPIGGATRDYLDNPRLIPEDSPNPSVIALEAPAPKTLESFLSGEATFRYRYRLTAISRATGLSSHEEVEVHVLSRRPVVYCPLEVVVEEGETVSLDCEGAGPLSFRMDYDEESASALWKWEGLWGTDLSPLDATDLSSPLFTAPAGSAGAEYHYIASMTTSASGTPHTARRRVTVKVEDAEGGGQRTSKAGISDPLDNLKCTVFAPVYEGDPDQQRQCWIISPDGEQILNETWLWEHSYDPGILSAVNVPDPFFRVPDSVSETTRYHFLVRVDYQLSLSGNRVESQDVYVTVRNLETAIECEDPGSVQEGAANIVFSCSAWHRRDTGEIRWSWSPTIGLTGHDTGRPTFAVPLEVDRDTTWTYTVTASAPGYDPDEKTIKVKVRNTDALAPSVRCENASIYEGAGDITLDCTVANQPSGATYVWSGTDVANRLSGTDGYAPVFSAPGDIDEPGEADKNYEYTVTMSADGFADIVEDVRVTVLEKPNITWCATHTFSDYATVWEGAGDTIESSACTSDDVLVPPQGSPGGVYSYWWSVRGDTPEAAIDLLHSRTGRIASFSIPPYGTLDEDRTYEYQLAISAPNADAANWNWTVTVRNSALEITCDDPDPVYEGSPPFEFSCFATGPPGLTYAWSWSPADQLTDRDTATPTFAVPAEVGRDTTWTYVARVTTANADPDEKTVTVTVLNREPVAAACADPGSVYEGAPDIILACSVSGAPGVDPQYAYIWTALGDTPNTALLSAVDIASPTFYVPEEVDEAETYEYLLTVSAENAEDATAEVRVTVLDRVSPTEPDRVSVLGITVSASPLRFGVQSADTRASLDPMTDGISTRVSGPYHAGRMTLALDGDALRENAEMDLSIELASPAVLERTRVAEGASLVFTPAWSYAASCEQLSSQAIGGLYTETMLREETCRLLRFGGALDLADAPPGHYAGNLGVVLRSGEREETHWVEVTVTVVSSQRVITIGPGGVRLGASREVPAGLTADQNLSIYPDMAFLTGKQPTGAFELSNPSLVPLEVSTSARFGYTEATESGREIAVEDTTGSRLGDLSEMVEVYPGVLVLMPGEKGLVRYRVRGEARREMVDKGYAAFFDVVSAPRSYANLDRMPEDVDEDRTARVTMRVPGLYIPGEGASQLRARLLAISYADSLSATFMLETADRPFAGEVVAYDGDGRELGRSETLVYTRSRVRIPLDRMPEEGAVFLRFTPRGSGRAPSPTSVEWNAPRRNIGEAEYEETASPAAVGSQ